MCIYIYIYIYAYICIYSIYIYIYTNIQYTHLCVLIIHIYILVCMHKYNHTHTSKYINASIHSKLSFQSPQSVLVQAVDLQGKAGHPLNDTQQTQKIHLPLHKTRILPGFLPDTPECSRGTSGNSSFESLSWCK